MYQVVEAQLYKMDSWRLLSRSTNLKALQPIKQPLPSAGPSEREEGPTKKQKISNFEPKSEAECRRLLKIHNLKVVWMSQGLQRRKRKGSSEKAALTQLIPQPLESFQDLGARYKISKRLASNLVEQGYSVPTEVQLGTIPLLLGSDEERGLARLTKAESGERSHVDLLTVAPTGSGKTLAFLIPIIQKLLDIHYSNEASKVEGKTGHPLEALILAPTHELVNQITNETRKLIIGTALKVAAMRKGMSISQADGENLGGQEGSGNSVQANIIVSTPLGLLNSLPPQFKEASTLKLTRFLVLDEADVLLDPLFREQTLQLWEACASPELEVSLWSATIGSSIERLAQDIIAERYERLKIPLQDRYIVRVVAGLKDSALPTISHHLVYAANEQGKLIAIRQILHPSSTDDSSTPTIRPPFLVFTQTIERATALHSELLYDIPVEAVGSSRIAVLHSSLSETARSDIMTGFRKGEVWVLITTDLLSRGVDFRGVNGVVNYDIPNTSAAYVHRTGRTGRAGREGGIAVTLYTKEDIPYVKNIANIVAASDSVRGKGPSETIPKWLLAALPDVKKNTKKDLKKRGVKERRPGREGSRATRITTKSGFERREQNRKKGAVIASKKRKARESEIHNEDDDEEEWGGIED